LRALLTLAAVALLGAPAFGQMTTSGSMTRSRMMTPHCSATNPVVWVNTRSHVYYMRGSAYYGKTTYGRYVCRSAATAMGAHRAGMMGANSTMQGSGTSGSMMPGSMMHGAKHDRP